LYLLDNHIKEMMYLSFSILCALHEVHGVMEDKKEKKKQLCLSSNIGRHLHLYLLGMLLALSSLPTTTFVFNGTQKVSLINGFEVGNIIPTFKMTNSRETLGSFTLSLMNKCGHIISMVSLGRFEVIININMNIVMDLGIYLESCHLMFCYFTSCILFMRLRKNLYMMKINHVGNHSVYMDEAVHIPRTHELFLYELILKNILVALGLPLLHEAYYYIVVGSTTNMYTI
ncbi:hypothetical protein ACJX0J_027842, partial [Zea mays]